MNLIISLLPPAFLIGLCVLGIIWVLNGKRHRQQSGTVPMALHFSSTDGNQIRVGNQAREIHQQRLPHSLELKQQLAQIIQRLGLTSTGINRYSSDRVVLAWEKQGQELHIILQSENKQLIQQLLTLLSESTLHPPQENNQCDF